MKESLIESTVNNYAKKLGWLCFKFTSPMNNGVPDRIYIRNGKIIFIEFKATKGKPTPLQKLVIRKMRGQGATVFVCDSVEKGKAIFDEIEAKDGPNPFS